MRWLFELAWHGITLAVTLLVYCLAAVLYTACLNIWFMQDGVPYNIVDGIEMLESTMLFFLVWDRFTGPYAKLLKGVANRLFQAKTRRTEDYERRRD